MFQKMHRGCINSLNITHAVCCAFLFDAIEEQTAQEWYVIDGSHLNDQSC